MDGIRRHTIVSGDCHRTNARAGAGSSRSIVAVRPLSLPRWRSGAFFIEHAL